MDNSQELPVQVSSQPRNVLPIENNLKQVDHNMWREIGYFLQDSNQEPSESQERIVNALCIIPADVADVYLLSHIDEPSSVDDPKTANMTGLQEIRYHQHQKNPDRSSLFYQTLNYSTALANKHVLAATRAMVYEYMRWSNKDSGQENLFFVFPKMISLLENNENVDTIVKNLNLGEVFNSLTIAFERHSVNWQNICKATTDLYSEIKASKESFSHRWLLTRLTYLHNAIHAGGAGVLELMLRPGQKNLGSELLLRFNSEDTRLVNTSMFEFGSVKAKTLFQKDRRQREPFSLLNPEPLSEEETQILLAESLLKDQWLSGRIDRISKSLSRYPLFETVLSNIFHGDLNPQDEYMKTARSYLRAAIDARSVDPSDVVSKYLQQEDSINVFDVAQNPRFLSSLSSEIQNRIFKKTIVVLGGTKPEERIKALMFIEVADVLYNSSYSQDARDEILRRLIEARTRVEPDSREYYFYERILGENE